MFTPSTFSVSPLITRYEHKTKKYVFHNMSPKIPKDRISFVIFLNLNDVNLKFKVPPKARRDMNFSECVYKVESIFIQNGDFDVTVGKRDAKSLKRDRSDITVRTKNSRKRASKTRFSQP